VKRVDNFKGVGGESNVETRCLVALYVGDVMDCNVRGGADRRRGVCESADVSPAPVAAAEPRARPQQFAAPR